MYEHTTLTRKNATRNSMQTDEEWGKNTANMPKVRESRTPGI
jgi:hypothetical protein